VRVLGLLISDLNLLNVVASRQRDIVCCLASRPPSSIFRLLKLLLLFVKIRTCAFDIRI
jgi:hypothetical protein